MSLNQHLTKTIQIAVYTTGTISIFSILLIVIIFIHEVKRKKTTPAFKLIFNLAICELVNTIAILMLYFPDFTDKKQFNQTLCNIQGPLILFSDIAQHLIASVISVYIIAVNFKANKINENSKLTDFLSDYESNTNCIYNKKLNAKNIIFYVFISYAFAALITSIGIFYDVFGVNKFNCWINEEYETLIFIYDCIIWVLIFFNFLIAIKIFRMKFSYLDNNEIKHRLEFAKNLSYYPIITLISFLILTLSDYISFEKELLIIYDNSVNIVFNLLSGFIYAIICFNSFRFRKKISKWIRRFSVRSNKKSGEQLHPHDFYDSLEESNNSYKYSFSSTVADDYSEKATL